MFVLSEAKGLVRFNLPDNRMTRFKTLAHLPAELLVVVIAESMLAGALSGPDFCFMLAPLTGNKL
jgi:hypothetical protein